jgi:hypothetical protein
MISRLTPACGFVLSILWVAAQAAPLSKPRGAIDNDIVMKVIPRDIGDENNPIPATFDVSGWQDIAEGNCYVILCDYGGNLKWYLIVTLVSKDES